MSPCAMTLRMPGCVDKIPNDLDRPFRRGEQVNVANDFLRAPQAARRAATDHVRMLAQTVEQRLGDGQRVTQAMFGGVLALARDTFE